MNTKLNNKTVRNNDQVEESQLLRQLEIELSYPEHLTDRQFNQKVNEYYNLQQN